MGTGRLAGKVAVVTGAGNGLGRATAVRFAEEGAVGIVIADLQPDSGNETVRLVEEYGCSAIFVQHQATSPGDNETALDTALESFGGIDVLVTAAGVSRGGYHTGDADARTEYARRVSENLTTPWIPFLETTADEVREVVDINLIGTFLAVQGCAERMIELGSGGSIITIASIMARSDLGPVPYNVSKAGVWMLTKIAARALATKGIRVNSIGPGYVETYMTSAVAEMSDEYRQDYMARIPMGRLGRPVEVANTALFLASDESSYFTGELLHPDGGVFTG